MARFGYGIAALASLGFLAWFLVAKLESPGLSIGVALIAIPLLLALFGFSKVSASGVGKDGKAAGWAAVIIAILGVGYVAAFFWPWLIVAVLWFAAQVPMIIGIVTSPTAGK